MKFWEKALETFGIKEVAMDCIKKSCVFYECMQGVGSHIDTCQLKAEMGNIETPKCGNCIYYIHLSEARAYLSRYLRKEYGSL